MTRYRIFGNELSPYSVKVRSFFRYKNIAHDWIVRSAANEADFRRYAKLPLIPVVVGENDRAYQDSTPILEHFETLFPEPSIHPAEPAAAFLSALIEEYGDEWGNKPMFHYRWYYEADQQSAGERLAASLMPEADPKQGAEMIKARMIPRLGLVGSSADTKDVIEGSFLRQLSILDAHLGKRPYLFGGRPAFADFGLFAQLYECSTDPTPGALLRSRAPRVLAWIERMLAPSCDGPFEPWAALEPTLFALLRDEVGGLFLPWSDANAKALATGEQAFTVHLDGRPYRQEAQKYHAKSLAALRARYAAASAAGLDSVLQRSGCLDWLR